MRRDRRGAKTLLVVLLGASIVTTAHFATTVPSSVSSPVIAGAHVDGRADAAGDAPPSLLHSVSGPPALLVLGSGLWIGAAVVRRYRR